MSRRTKIINNSNQTYSGTGGEFQNMRKSGNDLIMDSNLKPRKANKYYQIKHDPYTITNNSKNIFYRGVYKIRSPDAPIRGMIKGNSVPE